MLIVPIPELQDRPPPAPAVDKGPSDSSSPRPASPSTVVSKTAPTVVTAAAAADNETTTTTVEWILWKHCCQQKWAQSEKEWVDGVKEVSHLFGLAHPQGSSSNSSSSDTNDDKESFVFDLRQQHLPLPSQSFFLKTTVLENGQHQVDQTHTEYSLFQKGIFPEWEDEDCQGELYAKHYLPPELLDVYWQRLAQGVLDGTIDHRYVVGIRVVDKSKGKHPMYKLEVWLNTTCSAIVGKMSQQAMACLQQEDERYHFNLHFRAFRTSDKSKNTNEPVVTKASATVTSKVTASTE